MYETGLVCARKLVNLVCSVKCSDRIICAAGKVAGKREGIFCAVEFKLGNLCNKGRGVESLLFDSDNFIVRDLDGACGRIFKVGVKAVTEVGVGYEAEGIALTVVSD